MIGNIIKLVGNIQVKAKQKRIMKVIKQIHDVLFRSFLDFVKAILNKIQLLLKLTSVTYERQRRDAFRDALTVKRNILT